MHAMDPVEGESSVQRAAVAAPEAQLEMADATEPAAEAVIEEVAAAEAPSTSTDAELPDLPAVDAVASDNVEATASLDELRQKVLEARGSHSQLPPGFADDDDPADVAPADVDSDSDSDSDSSSSASSSSSSSSDATAANRTQQATGSVNGDDGDDDDDEDGAAAGGNRGPMSKNELQNADASKLLGELPFQEVPAELLATLSPLGKVHGAVDDVLVIAQFEEKQGAKQNERSGPVLDAGSLLCTSAGKVIGFVFETFGSLLAPLYSVLMPSAAVAKEHAPDSDIFFLPSYSTLLRPAELRARQGKASDASNVHDEEPNEWEIDAMEFSDDEEEQEWKRRLKDKKRANKRGLDAAGGDAESALGEGRGGGARGRGRGAARGRGRGAAAGPSRGGGRAAATPAGLPPRPNWQLDDDVGGQTSQQLSYDDDGGAGGQSAAVEAAESKPLAPAPQSAGLPANPLANVPGAVYGEAPPPGAHINPLFAHRWQPQAPAAQSQQQAPGQQQSPQPPAGTPTQPQGYGQYAQQGYQQQNYQQPYYYQQHAQQAAYPQYPYQQQQPYATAQGHAYAQGQAHPYWQYQQGQQQQQQQQQPPSTAYDPSQPYAGAQNQQWQYYQHQNQHQQSPPS